MSVPTPVYAAIIEHGVGSRRAERGLVKRVAACWIILGFDGSIIKGPYWWRESAQEDCQQGCVVIAAKLTYDDRKYRAKKRA